MMFVLHDVSISAAATTVKAFKLFIFLLLKLLSQFCVLGEAAKHDGEFSDKKAGETPRVGKRCLNFGANFHIKQSCSEKKSISTVLYAG